jgi:hypothetical protein
MRGRGIDVEIVLFDVLSMIALAIYKPEETLLEDRVALVPEAERETETALAVRDAQEPVLTPAVGATAGVIVREIGPGRTV